MRTFELTARVDAISRGDGRSATAAAAYRACCAIECEREGGKVHDYTRKRGLELSEIVIPASAPKWATDRAKLWNAAELREKNGKRGARAGEFKQDAQVAREVLFTFPAELSAEGRAAAAQRIARHLVETHNVAADYSIHAPGMEGDVRNHHCHLMMTTRRLTSKGLGEKVREWSDKFEGKSQTKELRAFIAATLNDQLRQEGKSHLVHVEHRSFADRGSAQRPTLHQGAQRTNILRKQLGAARAAWQREQKTAMAERHARERAALKTRQDFALQGKLGELAERQRVGETAINRDLAAQRQADQLQQKTGIRGIFRNLTGRAGREAFQNRANEGQRVEAARQKTEALRAEIATERRDFMATQQRDHAALTDTHKKEVGQVRQAVEARHQIDRGVERDARQPSAAWMKIERAQDQGRSIGRELSP